MKITVSLTDIGGIKDHPQSNCHLLNAIMYLLLICKVTKTVTLMTQA